MNVKDWVTALQESLTTNADRVLAFAPKLVGALVLLLAGYVSGRLAAMLVRRILQLIGTDRLIARTAIQTLLDRSGVKRSLSYIIGVIAFWVIFLLFLISATEVLGLALLSNVLLAFATYLPKIGMAVLIVVLGLAGAAFLRELIAVTCSSAGISQGTIVAQTFYVFAVLLIVVTAINQLGIDTMLLNSMIIILAAGLIGGATIAFGLGARPAITNIIAAHYLQSVFRIGQHIRIGNLKGDIVAMTPIAVVLETDDGRVIVPASRFTETEAVITAADGGDAT